MFRIMIIGLLVTSAAAYWSAAAPSKSSLSQKGGKQPNLPAGALARLGTSPGQTLPAGKTTAATYSSDSKMIATTHGYDGITVSESESWKKITHVTIKALDDHQGGGGLLHGLDFSPDGKRIAWSGIQVIGVSDLETGKELWRNQGTCQVAFTSDGKSVIAGGIRFQWDLKAYSPAVFDAQTGKLVHRFTDADTAASCMLLSFTISRDGTTVALALQSRSEPFRPRLEIWDVATGKLRIRFDPSPANDVVLSPDGKTMAFAQAKVAGDFSSTRLVFADTQSGKELRRVEMPGQSLSPWQYLPDGKHLLAGGTTHDPKTRGWTFTTYLLDAASGKQVRRFDFAPQLGWGMTAMSPDGKRFLSFGQWSDLRVWDVETLRVLPAYVGHRSAPRLLAFDETGKTLVSADQHTVCIWDLQGRTLKKWLTVRGVENLNLEANGMSVLQNMFKEQMVLRFSFADEGYQFLFQDVQAKKLLLAGKYAARTHQYDGDIDILDVTTGKKLQTCVGHQGDVHALAFSRDGSRLLSASRTRPIIKGGGKGGQKIIIVPPIPDETVRLWDALEGKQLAKWDLGAETIALTPDAKILVAGDAKGGLRRFETATAKELPALAGHQAKIHTLQFSNDGSRLASRDVNGHAIIWDLTASKELKRLDSTAIALSGDGRLLASSGEDGTILLWDVGPAK